MEQEQLIDFLLLRDPNVMLVVVGTMFLGASAALVGAFSFLRKQSLIGDAIAHSILPGVVLAFLFTSSKNPFYLMIGALISGWISVMGINYIQNYTKLKGDAAIAIVLSFFFALGIMFLTYAQHLNSLNASGLDHFLFGKAAAMNSNDVMAFSILSLLVLLAVIFFRRAFILLSFDMDFAKSRGLPVRYYEVLLSSLTILAIALGIQAVGMILMAALIITPAAASRQWTNKMDRFLSLAVLFGVLAAYSGSFLSYSAPKMPTGPWIVMALSLITFVSVIFAPEKGLLARRRVKRRNKKKILHENIIKAFYQLSEKADVEFLTADDLSLHLNYDKQRVIRALQSLKRKGFVYKVDPKWSLSSEGEIESRRIVRLHRLWELYLTKKMLIDPDLVHSDAEAIEHVITPEIEFQLTKELGDPDKDPHSSLIPPIHK